ncbi:MAG: homoserine dehydrogenase [Rickettsiales bacterium]|nr:homoserine dehydrogenase [Rickettsiales bacterium]
MSETLRIGIAGLGTVGVGTVRLIQDNAALLAERAGRTIEVVAVSSRDKSKDRGVDLSGMAWYDDARDLAKDENVDVVVELIGGSEGIAKELVEAALSAGKDVVTANKALIAHHGLALAQLADESHAALCFEAAVAGGIPIINALTHGLSANRFSLIAGILNGTGNYILTTMQKDGREFGDVLKEAQDLGYAEADPSFDIDGIDTAHKLAIITSLAYGVPIDFDSIFLEGIRNITASDIEQASALGYTIKLLGITQQTDQGIVQRVHPCLVPANAPIGVIDGAFNAIHIEGNAIGRTLLEGPGAGAGPTASSVVSDLVQVARGVTSQPFNIAIDAMAEASFVSMEHVSTRYYLRFSVKDETGVLSDITSIFAQHDISVQSLIQQDSKEDGAASIVMTTHKTVESAMTKALQAIDALDSILQPTHKIRIEDL